MRLWVRCGIALLLCWPLLARAQGESIRVTELAQPPPLPLGSLPLTGADQTHATQRAWLHAPHDQVDWYEIKLSADWRANSRPLLVIGNNLRADVRVFLPPAYDVLSKSKFDVDLAAGFSRHAMVFPLPRDLRANQPIYIKVGHPGQVAPFWLSVIDETSYRVADLTFVRANTFFVSVQLSMLLVILCFWAVLRDRVYVFFVLYVLFLVGYAMAMSGELYALPGAALLSPLKHRLIYVMAAMASGFSVWFILEFAELRRYTPRLARWLGATRWPHFGMALLACLTFLNVNAWWATTHNYLLIVTVILVLASTWLAWRHGNRQAGFFLLSWAPLLALLLVRIGQLIAGLRQPAWLEYAFPGSMAWAAVVIAVGLADRTLQVRRERDKANRMAQFDPLTGIFNRRAIAKRLHQAWSATGDTMQPLAVLFLDLDHFKQINDRFGHAAGDACLVAITEAIRAELGEEDRVGRYGGEEFLIVLCASSAATGRRVAERIVERVAALRVPVGEHQISLTVSIGLALRDPLTASVEDLVNHADQAQYRAKAEGRNRVVVY